MQLARSTCTTSSKAPLPCTTAAAIIQCLFIAVPASRSFQTVTIFTFGLTILTGRNIVNCGHTNRQKHQLCNAA
jgi:hypothetical protein